MVPDKNTVEKTAELDERLLATPTLALKQRRDIACEMADPATNALKNSLTAVSELTPERSKNVRADEEMCDHYEDILGTYLVKLSALRLGVAESEEATALLKSIGDFERISGHAVDIIESAEEM